jgi:citrate synthase
VESCYLLLHGELPTPSEKKQFNHDITRHTMVPEQLIQFYRVRVVEHPALLHSALCSLKKRVDVQLHFAHVECGLSGLTQSTSGVLAAKD